MIVRRFFHHAAGRRTLLVVGHMLYRGMRRRTAVTKQPARIPTSQRALSARRVGNCQGKDEYAPISFITSTKDSAYQVSGSIGKPNGKHFASFASHTLMATRISTAMPSVAAIVSQTENVAAERFDMNQSFASKGFSSPKIGCTEALSSPCANVQNDIPPVARPCFEGLHEYALLGMRSHTAAPATGAGTQSAYKDATATLYALATCMPSDQVSVSTRVGGSNLKSENMSALLQYCRL
jgi:hypothetical protein